MNDRDRRAVKAAKQRARYWQAKARSAEAQRDDANRQLQEHRRAVEYLSRDNRQLRDRIDRMVGRTQCLVQFPQRD